MNRKDVLEAAQKRVCEDRERQYGSPEDDFDLIAGWWTGYLRAKLFPYHRIDGKDVAVMMALLKIASISTDRYKQDNYIDLAGYAACGGELASRYAPRVDPVEG